MLTRRRSSPPSVALVAFVLLGVPTLGASDRPDDSPFVPAGFGAAAPAAAASPIDRFEFRGVMTLGLETFVTLVDTASSKSLTLTLGEQLEGVRATDFRPDDGSVQVESGGQSRRLKLREAKIIAMAVPPPAPPPVPGAPAMAGQPNPAVAGAPISDEDARARMQRVADEIRRRREMRRQMLQNPQQPAPPAPAN